MNSKPKENCIEFMEEYEKQCHMKNVTQYEDFIRTADYTLHDTT